MENSEHLDTGLFESIETEIERKGIALGIDWSNPAAVQQIVREAFDHTAEDVAAIQHGDNSELARCELRGLIAVMLKSMARSNGEYLHAKHSPIWGTLWHALRGELDRRALDASASSPPGTKGEQT